MILTYHVTEQSWVKPKLNLLARKRTKKKKKKMTGRGNPEGEEIKRERGKDKRHLGTEVERKKELQGLKPTIQHSIFLSFLFPRGDSCPVILLTDALLQALFPEVDRRNPSAAISSLPSPVAPLLMDCFSLSFHPGESPQV